MLLKSLKLSNKGLLAALLVVTVGGFSSAYAADAGAGAAGVGTQLPKATPPTLPMPDPVKPVTLPAVPAPAATVPTPAATIPTPGVPAPADAATTSADTAATGVAGNKDGSCPESAPVKVSKSKIYHVPEGRDYKKTKAKKCFETAEAAQQAGYRAPKK